MENQLNPQQNSEASKLQGEKPSQRQSLVQVQQTIKLLRQLEERQRQLETRDPQLARSIDNVAEAFWDRSIERVASEGFKTDLAYVVQDVEKATGPLNLQPGQREEFSRLASSAPGLENARMQKLLELTPTIADPQLVATLREKANDIASESDQNTKSINEEIGELSFRVATAPRVAAPQEPQPKQSPAPGDHEDLAGQSVTEAPAVNSPSVSAASIEAPKQEQERESPEAAPGKSEPGDDAASRAESLARAQLEIAAFDDTPAPTEDAGPEETSRADADSPVDKQSMATAEAPANEPAAAPDSAPASGAEARTPEQQSPPTVAAQPPAVAALKTADAATTTKQPASSQGASAAKTPARAERPEEEELDPAEIETLHQIQIVSPGIAIGGAVGKAVNVVGKSASAFGRILQGVTPQYQQEEKPAAERRASQQASQGRAASEQNSNKAQTLNLNSRLKNFEQTRMQPKRDEDQFYAADAAGNEALNALNAFREAPGVAVLNRIQEAAANNKGGMQAVIAGMAPGGAFEDLRKEFNNAISNDGPLTQAYDQAAKALEKYGDTRAAIIPALASHPNGAKWSQHFEKLDGAVGEAASNTPGQTNAISALEHLGEKAREIVEKILEKIQAVFRRDAEARPSPSASPGP